ncbi:DHH family phosphoesterase [Melioribacter sp. OK-6-Me]|uniref:DHH family phosphoesterase n=1 Tax=unclassified Melioribacter TaxID=2627329 RepID=UPI003EDAD7B4
MNYFTELKNILDSYESFTITSHVNPDADAICSELACFFLLQKLNKRVRIINYSPTPNNLKFLDANGDVEQYDPEKHDNYILSCEVILFLDLNSISRTKRMENVLRNSKARKVCIDHHQEPENSFDLLLVDTNAAATGEILYDFIKSTKISEIDYRIALQLYSAIMTDTGSFRYERTSPKIHTIAGELIQKGVNPTEVYDKIYNQTDLNILRLLGKSISNINTNLKGSLAYMIITKDDLNQYGVNESDVDGFVTYCMSIKNVVIGLLFLELDDGIKISFRSKGDIKVNKLAAEFGGGGHINAAGARLYDKDMNKVVNDVILKAQKYIGG